MIKKPQCKSAQLGTDVTDCTFNRERIRIVSELKMYRLIYLRL